MIRITFFKSGDLFTGFESKGHSGASESGSDIVCAFVSSACYMAANTVTEIIKAKADAFQEDGYMRLKVKESPNRVQDILRGMHLHLSELQKEYPENIKVIITEE